MKDHAADNFAQSETAVSAVLCEREAAARNSSNAAGEERELREAARAHHSDSEQLALRVREQAVREREHALSARLLLEQSEREDATRAATERGRALQQSEKAREDLLASHHAHLQREQHFAQQKQCFLQLEKAAVSQQRAVATRLRGQAELQCAFATWARGVRRTRTLVRVCAQWRSRLLASGLATWLDLTARRVRRDAAFRAAARSFQRVLRRRCDSSKNNVGRYVSLWRCAARRRAAGLRAARTPRPKNST